MESTKLTGKRSLGSTSPRIRIRGGSLSVASNTNADYFGRCPLPSLTGTSLKIGDAVPSYLAVLTDPVPAIRPSTFYAFNTQSVPEEDNTVDIWQNIPTLEYIHTHHYPTSSTPTQRDRIYRRALRCKWGGTYMMQVVSHPAYGPSQSGSTLGESRFPSGHASYLLWPFRNQTHPFSPSTGLVVVRHGRPAFFYHP